MCENLHSASFTQKLVYSPSKVRYASSHSSISERSTPRLYEQSEDTKNEHYYQPNHANCNVYDEYRRAEAEEGEQDDDTENNPGIRTARSERGLKRLSVKVRDLVYRLKETSYKDVANRLIEELVVDDEYDDYGNKLDRKMSSDRKTKEEKNVRRRVYDALNVLIASGVLKKNANKNVMYEERPENRMKGLKLIIKKKHQNKKRQLLKLLEAKRNAIQEKNIQYQEARSKFNAIQNLISRNKILDNVSKPRFNLMSHIWNGKRPTTRDRSVNDSSKLHFPLIILATPNTNDNKIQLCLSEKKDMLSAAFKKRFSVMGDMDILLKLDFHLHAE